jgi:hypothetical protein
MRIVEWL